MPRARKQLIAPIAVAAAAALAAVPAAAAATPRPKVEALSSRADAVTGGEALIGVQVPKGIKASRSRSAQRRQGRRRLPFETIRSAASDRPGRGVRRRRTGFGAGQGRLEGGRADRLQQPDLGTGALRPTPVTVLLRTEDAGLGPPADTDCSAPTQVEYRYRYTGGGFKPLADPAARPADLAQTTTRDGATVDYVVRVESGVINRSVYRWAVLAPGGVVAEGWNGRLIHSFGGGCGAGSSRGRRESGRCSTTASSRGASRSPAPASPCSVPPQRRALGRDTLDGQRAPDRGLGRAPVWTLGEGGSGGSIQQQMIAQNYPGLLDGLLPSASFPDNSESKNPDCRLLQPTSRPRRAPLSAPPRRPRSPGSPTATSVASARDRRRRDQRLRGL